MRGNPVQRKYMPVRRPDRQVGQRCLPQLQRIGQADPHAHGLRRLRQLRCDRAGQGGVDRAGYVVGRYALDAGPDRVDRQVQRIAGQLDAAFHLHDAVDLADRGGDLSRPAGSAQTVSEA